MNLIRINGRQDLRRVSRSDKLAPRKRHREFVNDLPLPFGVQMQINLVDQHDRFRLGDGVAHFRVGLDKASCQVEHQHQGAALTVRHLPHRHGTAAMVDQQPWALGAVNP